MIAASILGALAAFFAALWWGERGRRIDAQRREERLPVIEHEPVPAIVRRDIGSAVPAPVSAELEAPEKFILETMEETGCTREEAVAEWGNLLGQVHSDHSPSPDPFL